jgi:hypothetical protein
MGIFDRFKSPPSPTPNEKDHKLGIHIVHDNLVKEGYEIEAVSTELGEVPQIVASKEGSVFFFIVMTARGALPLLHPQTRQNCLVQAKKFNATTLFAPVALMATGQTDAEGFFVKYQGYSNV